MVDVEVISVSSKLLLIAICKNMLELDLFKLLGPHVFEHNVNTYATSLGRDDLHKKILLLQLMFE
jgi:hypothetical protein